MSFEPQNRLEESLVKATTDPAHRPQFYRDFVESDVFIIQQRQDVPDTDEMTMLKEGTGLEIQSIEYRGKPYIPIFSSLPRLQAVLTEEAGYLAMNALAFLELTQGADLLLNPGSEYGKELLAQEVALILDGSIGKPSQRYVAKQDTQVLIGQPKNYPTELVDALTRLFKGKKEVKRAWVAHFFNPQEDEKPHTLVGIEASGDFDSVVLEASAVAGSIRVPDPPVDFIRVTGKDGVASYFRKAKSFYERRFLSLF